jgi:putative NADPH-quinone reductase
MTKTVLVVHAHPDRTSLTHQLATTAKHSLSGPQMAGELGSDNEAPPSPVHPRCQRSGADLESK